MQEDAPSILGYPRNQRQDFYVLGTPSDSGTAIELARRGRDKEAEKTFRGQIERNPLDPVAHHNYAVFLSEHQRFDEATECYTESLRLRPDYPEALRNFAVLLSGKRQFTEAVEKLRSAVRLRPDDAQTLAMLGITLIAARKAKEAIPIFRQAVRLAPKDAIIRNQCGLGYFDAGCFDEAERTFLEALDLDPRLVSAHNNLGSLYKAMGRTQEAFSSFEIALSLDPASTLTKWNRALTLLSAGDFERGWQEYEWRWHRPETPPRKLPKPLWNGEPLEGKRILLHTEQGLGDTIQFIRYARLLKNGGAHVIFECQAPLMGVLRRLEGVDELLMEGQPLPPFDYHAPLMGLPRIFKTTLTTIPTFDSYITHDEKKLATWQDYFKPQREKCKLLVGLAWQGNPHHQWDHFRSVPLILFEPLARIPGIQLVSVQRGPGIEQIEEFQKLTNSALLVPTDGQQTTPAHLAETAAMMSALDLIISVDTAPAHLAGALGRPIWTLLSFVADWRWMTGRRTTPWYPSMRIYQQKTFGDWDGVISNVFDDIHHWFQIRSITGI